MNSVPVRASVARLVVLFALAGRAAEFRYDDSALAILDGYRDQLSASVGVSVLF